MKLLYLTDTHITAKTPSSRLDDIQDTIKMKFSELGVLIEKEGIEAVLHGGDMFHRPEVSNKFVGEIAEIIRGYGVPFYVLIGNHDLQGQNSESLPHTKLGLLSSTGVIKIIDRNNPVVFNDNGYKISVEGQEYHPNIDREPDKDYKIYNETADYKILMTHSMLLEKSFHEGTTYTLIKDVKTDADLVLGGHYHPGFKEQQVNGTWFYNPGSSLRVEASTHSINNKPKVLVMDISKDNKNIAYYEYKTAKEGKEVFSDTNLEKKIYNNTLESFNKKLKDIKLDDVNIVALVDEYVKEHPEDSVIVEKAKAEIVKIQKEQVVDNGFVSTNTNVLINHVEIKNFQVHEHKVVDFTKGLNTITGESNAGKSAIIRAILWCLYDKPSGNGFIRTGKKNCSVKVTLSNGYIIERKRSRSASGSYILTKPDGTETEYKGFANSVPIDIINAHQMPEVKIGGNKYRLNVSSQLDAPFLVCSSSNEKLATIGALVDADRADEARSVVLNEKRKLSASIKSVEDLREKEVKKLEKYTDLDKLKTTVELLEMADEKLDRDEADVNLLVKLKEDYHICSSNMVLISNELNSIQIIDKDIIDDFNKELNMLESLMSLMTLYKGNTYQISKINHELSLLGATVSEDDIKEYNKLLNECEALIAIKNEYNNVNDVLHSINNEISSMPNILSESDIKEYTKLLQDIEEMKELKATHNMLSEMSFEFEYDIDTIKNIRNEYVQAIKEFKELESIRVELDSIGTKNNQLDDELKLVENSIKICNSQKEEKMKELQNTVQVCKTCGSEVSADRLLESAM